MCPRGSPHRHGFWYLYVIILSPFLTIATSYFLLGSFLPLFSFFLVSRLFNTGTLSASLPAMYNVQFQQPSYGTQRSSSQRQQHQDVNAAAAMGNDHKAFPSPLTTSSLDSPPTHQKIQHHAPASPKPYPSSSSSATAGRVYHPSQQQQHPYNTPTPSYAQPSPAAMAAAAAAAAASSMRKDMSYYGQDDPQQQQQQQQQGESWGSPSFKQQQQQLSDGGGGGGVDEELQQRK